MGDAVMPTQSKRRIITNRQLNFTLSPVDTHNHKEMPYKLSNYAIDGTWNQHQSIVLDIILDGIFKNRYEKYKNIPKSWRSPNVTEENRNFVGALFNPVVLTYMSNKPVEAFSLQTDCNVVATEKERYESIDSGKSRYDNIGSGKERANSFEEHFNEFLKNNIGYQSFIAEMDKKVLAFNGNVICRLRNSTLYKNYPLLNHYKRKFYEYVQRVANTKFKMNYKVKCLVKPPEYNKEGQRTHAGTMLDGYYAMQDFQQIISVTFEGDEIVVNFNSPLGKMILHNMLLLDTDWVPDEVLTLGKNAFFIYKRFILNRVSGKKPPNEIELWFEEIKEFLDLNWGNNSGIYTVLDRAFAEMQQKGLLKGHSWNKNYTKQRQYRLNF
jgi:hypothetical protein